MKTLQLKTQESPAQLPQLKPLDLFHNKLLIRSKKEILFVPVNHISYLKSFSNYCEINFGVSRKLISSKTLGSYESKLNANFYRIHHGYIINVMHISKINLGENVVIMDNGTSLPISRSRKQAFLNTFKNQ